MDYFGGPFPGNPCPFMFHGCTHPMMNNPSVHRDVYDNNFRKLMLLYLLIAAFNGTGSVPENKREDDLWEQVEKVCGSSFAKSMRNIYEDYVEQGKNKEAQSGD